MGEWQPDLDLDMVRNLAWIILEVFISLKLMRAKINVLVEAQSSSDKLCQDGWGGVVVGWGVSS